MPKVSLIIPIYNNQQTIEKCLDSILKQSFTDYEVVVMNDGSTDRTLEILKTYGRKIQVFSQENQGAPAARNNGYKKSAGEYVFFCDADIIMKPDALKKMVRLLDSDDSISYVYSSFRHGWKKFNSFDFDPELLRKMPYINTATLIRRQDFPGWDESLKKFQDWDLWLTMLEAGCIGKRIPEVLFRIQTEDATISSWLPKFIYKIPWLQNKNIKKYKLAEKIIFEKHKLGS